MHGACAHPRRCLAATLLLLLPFLANADVLAGAAAAILGVHGGHAVALRTDAAHVDVVLLHDSDARDEDEGRVVTSGAVHPGSADEVQPHPRHEDHRIHLWTKGIGGAGIAATHAAPVSPPFGPAAVPVAASLAVLRVAAARFGADRGPQGGLERLRTVVLRA